ncbi:MAG: outer membrane beta-barrel protein [Cyclobacteriaceae bacterium]
MKQFVGLFICMIAMLTVVGQGKDRPVQPDVPGDISIDFGFNLLMGDKGDLETNFWHSKSVSLYYMYTHKLSDLFTVNPQLGFSIEKIGFGNEMNYVQNSDRTFTFDSIQGVTVNSSKLAMNYVELPIEFRYYPLKTIDGEGFFIGVGPIIGAKIESYTKVRYETRSESPKTDKQQGVFGLSDVRYGLVGRFGFKGVNAFAKYYISDIWRNGPNGASPNLFTVGINFTGF